MTACSEVCEHHGLLFPGNRRDGNLPSSSVGLYKLRNNFQLPILGKNVLGPTIQLRKDIICLTLKHEDRLRSLEPEVHAINL